MCRYDTGAGLSLEDATQVPGGVMLSHRTHGDDGTRGGGGAGADGQGRSNARVVGLCTLNQVDPYPITYSLSNP